MTHPALFFPLQSQLSYLGPCFLRSQLMRLILLPTAVSLNLSPGDLGSKISGGLWYLSYHQRFQTQEPWFSMVLFNSFRDTFGQGIFYWCTKTEPFRGGYNTKEKISFFSCNTVPDASTRRQQAQHYTESTLLVASSVAFALESLAARANRNVSMPLMFTVV